MQVEAADRVAPKYIAVPAAVRPARSVMTMNGALLSPRARVSSPMPSTMK